LQAEDCEEGQGYYFSRPLGAQQFARVLEAGTTQVAGRFQSSNRLEAGGRGGDGVG
jgi:hypothetical protein